MNKQGQVEAMAVLGCVRDPKAHTAEECAKCDFKQGMCNSYRHAEALYNAGYRKTFTGDFASNTQKAFKEGYQKGKTDTLERVAKYLDTQIRYFGLGYRIKQHLSEIDELLQEYKE